MKIQYQHACKGLSFQRIIFLFNLFIIFCFYSIFILSCMKYFAISFTISLAFVSEALRITNQHLQKPDLPTITPAKSTIIPISSKKITTQLKSSLNNQEKVVKKQVQAAPLKQQVQNSKKSSSTKPQKTERKQNKTIQQPSESPTQKKPKDKQIQSSKSQQESEKVPEPPKNQKPAPLPVPGLNIEQKPKEQTKKTENKESTEQKGKKNDSQAENKKEQKEMQLKKVEEKKVQGQKSDQKDKNSTTATNSQQWTKKDEQQFEQWKKSLIPVTDPKLIDDYNKLIQKQKQRRIREKNNKSKGHE